MALTIVPLRKPSCLIFLIRLDVGMEVRRSSEEAGWMEVVVEWDVAKYIVFAITDWRAPVSAD